MAIKNDKKVSIFFVLQNKIFIRISCLLRAFQSWTGVLQVQLYFEIIDYFIFGMFYLLFNLIDFVTARGIHGFLTLSSRLQIHENATEITST